MECESAVLNLWYVTADNPGEVLAAEPKADRGYGRKYLAQLNPAFPITPIGQFPLNRSAQADAGEFYIGGYPGVTVVQTVVTAEATRLSELSPLLLRAAPAEHVFAFAEDPNSTYAAFAHWDAGELKRSFCASRYNSLEDIGLPEPFEGPFWAGEHGEQLGGIALPFEPEKLMQAAQTYWLGVEIGPEGPDLHVVGYATDGRPEPKVDEPKKRTPKPTDELASHSAAKLGIGPGNGDYDDYEGPGDDTGTTESLKDLAHAVQRACRVTGRFLGSVGRRVGQVKDRWRS